MMMISNYICLVNFLNLFLAHKFSFFVFHGLVSVSSLKRLIRLWTERYPDATADPVNVWDDIITSRYEGDILKI